MAKALTLVCDACGARDVIITETDATHVPVGMPKLGWSHFNIQTTVRNDDGADGGSVIYSSPMSARGRLVNAAALREMRPEFAIHATYRDLCPVCTERVVAAIEVACAGARAS